MDIFSIITLLGGLAFFLYGMNVMSQGLEKMAGGQLETILQKMTSNRFKAMGLGIVVTAAIQSSSAVTVILVGLVNSGIMHFGSTIGIIMGANVGTTVTAWLLSMIGIESSNPFIRLLKPENFSLVFALVGIMLIMMSKSTKKKDIGGILIGFAVLMFGMELMSGAVEPLKDMPEFTSILTMFENPIFGILAGAILTGIIQSSSASVGILQALSMTGTINFSVALPIIMGQNIGTCVTALISSIGVNKNARKVSVVHIIFNLLGTLVWLIVFYALNSVFKFAFVNEAITPVDIAVVHSVFNISTTFILLPFTNQLEKIANFVIKKDENEKPVKNDFLDSRLLATPSVAVAECKKLTYKMAQVAQNIIHRSFSLFDKFNEDVETKMFSDEEELDLYEDKLGNYLITISSKGLSDADSRAKFMMLHNIGDFERLGDHALNLYKAAKELNTKKLNFTEDAQRDLLVLRRAAEEIVDNTVNAYINGDMSLAIKVEPLEQVIDKLAAEIKTKHIERLQRGECTIEMGFILSDILTNYERISDHCSNIAVAMIEINHGVFDTHKYLNSIKNSNNKEFNESYEMYEAKYSL
ncbi:MAG: Na/Pi cotransporter family protein [Clostridia bacterium]|nr:Na/Pi cotransporter family protein [Clostridia bacterium]